MVEVLEETYTYKDILTLIKSIYSILQEETCWFKEYIKTMNLKEGFKYCKTYPCILYRVNKLRAFTVTVSIYHTLSIGDKPTLMDAIECTKKEYVNRTMGELEDFAGCTIKRDLTKTTLNLFQPCLNTKTNQYLTRT